ncbi:hypothetical protein OHB13_11915 [Streptomyces sp. NBC_00440]|uniref:hypothetical protein n=1 Tax=Streptomyces sp. NBC_00440 TaxID=2975741 RepID=UPI002E1FD319
MIDLKAKGVKCESDWASISRADFGRVLGLFEEGDAEADKDETDDQVVYDAWAYLSTHRYVIREALRARAAQGGDPEATFALKELDHVMGT